MKVRDLVVLAYGAFGGTISGKTNLQKKVYFLGVGLGRESELGYCAHYYGPYSAAVAEANSELRSLGYLSECSTSWGSDQRGFEIARYDYSFTEEGKRLYTRKKSEHPELYKEIQRLVEAMRSACCLMSHFFDEYNGRWCHDVPRGNKGLIGLKAVPRASTDRSSRRQAQTGSGAW